MYSFLIFLLLAIVVSPLLQSFNVLLPHFASIQLHFVFKTFHLCVQIHQSHCSVPSWGGVHFKLIYLHLYVWISMPTYALYLKKVDEWLLYFLWYFVWDQSLFSTFTDIWGWLVLCLWIWIMVSKASFLFRVVCTFTGITKTRWPNSSDKH